ARLDERFVCREIDRVRVVGRVRPVVVHEVLHSALAQGLQEWWSAALVAYRARRWDEAVERFTTLVRQRPADGPASVYLERCPALQASPPPTEWGGGVFEAQVK